MLYVINLVSDICHLLAQSFGILYVIISNSVFVKFHFICL